MTTPLPATGYATVDDYELRHGVTVPDEQVDQVQLRLNDNSSLINLYMGDCADDVAAKWSDLLTTIVCGMTQRQAQQPAGLASASVGSTSVTYRPSDGGWMDNEVTDILDRLMADACAGADMSIGVGELGAGWGGPSTQEDPDILWVLAGPPRRQ